VKLGRELIPGASYSELTLTRTHPTNVDKLAGRLGTADEAKTLPGKFPTG